MSPDRQYRETIDYLYALQKHGIKLALSNSLRLMVSLGSPHRKFRSVHVAGTNGKGSTAAFIAGMLRAAGYRVGLYTSPHLVSFTERIRINGDPISEKRVVELAQRVRKAYGGLKPAGESAAMSPTFFEVTTAIAFIYFAEEEVDIAVIEVGMGGRLDSTNVIIPLVSVITNIDLEHTEFLGTTLEQIATEKAGIIKPGVPVVTGAVQPDVVSVIERTAEAKAAGISRLSRDFMPENVVSGAEPVFDYRGRKAAYEGLKLRLIGRYQVDNACLALAAVEYLREAGIAVDEQAVRRGLEQTHWEGRMERIAKRPDIYLDGAHNPASAKKLAATVGELKTAYGQLVLVIGILGDKDYQGIANEIVPLADRVVVTRPQYSRALDVPFLAGEIRKLHTRVTTAETVAEAIALARDDASSDDLILVTGSLYMVGDARALLSARPDEDGALTGLKG
jgi:dihydrofolate synthase/folylpolyglutamate synthase